MAKQVLVEFPETLPGIKLGLVAAERLPDDATQFDALRVVYNWSRLTLFGVKNEKHFKGRGPIALHLADC